MGGSGIDMSFEAVLSATKSNSESSTVGVSPIIHRDEKQLLSEVSCDDDYKYVVNNMDSLSVQTHLQRRFGNYKFMEDMACITRTITSSTTDDMQERSVAADYFNDLKVLGDVESASGHIDTVALDDTENILILKSVKIDKNGVVAAADLTHEAFVGTYGLNQLRQNVPNFSYILDSFQCNPVVNVDKEDYNLCLAGDSGMEYIIQEYVNPARPFGKFARTCSVEEFLDVFYQVMYALDYAHRQVDFTHYDLHTDNVMVRKLDATYQIKYETENGEEYIKTDKLAMIIDYGMSHIKYNETDYGYQWEKYGIFGQSSYIMHDVYKLIMFLALETRQRNPEVFDVLKQFYRFFSDKDELADISTDLKKHNYYALPVIGDSLSLTVQDFMSFVRQSVSFPISTTYDDNTPMLLDDTNYSVDDLVGNPCSDLNDISFRDRVVQKYVEVYKKIETYYSYVMQEYRHRNYRLMVMYMIAFFNNVMIFNRSSKIYENCDDPALNNVFAKLDTVDAYEQEIFNLAHDTDEIRNNDVYRELIPYIFIKE